MKTDKFQAIQVEMAALAALAALVNLAIQQSTEFRLPHIPSSDQQAALFMLIKDFCVLLRFLGIFLFCTLATKSMF